MYYDEIHRAAFLHPYPKFRTDLQCPASVNICPDDGNVGYRRLKHNGTFTSKSYHFEYEWNEFLDT